MRLLKGIKGVSIALLLSLISAAEVIETAIAMPTTPEQQIAQSVGQNKDRKTRRRLKFLVGVRASRYRVGGITRGAFCGNDQLVALVPPPQVQAQKTLSNKHSKSNQTTNEPMLVDKTIDEHPIFWVYFPASQATKAKFTLQNEVGTEQLYSVKFDVTGEAGVVGIVLPDSAPALQVGQKYFWQVALTCDPDDNSSDIVIGTWIERVPRPATREEDVISTLAEQGIWQDVVASLALERYQSPEDPDIAEDWASLMEQAGLPQFKQSKVIQIVKN